MLKKNVNTCSKSLLICEANHKHIVVVDFLMLVALGRVGSYILYSDIYFDYNCNIISIYIFSNLEKEGPSQQNQGASTNLPFLFYGPAL